MRSDWWIRGRWDWIAVVVLVSLLAGSAALALLGSDSAFVFGMVVGSSTGVGLAYLVAFLLARYTDGAPTSKLPFLSCSWLLYAGLAAGVLSATFKYEAVGARLEPVDWAAVTFVGSFGMYLWQWVLPSPTDALL